MLFKVYNILYDTDGKEVDLPKELYLDPEDSNDPADELSDMISDNTGYCHKGFEFDKVESTFSFGACPEDLIKKACNSQCPAGYTMTIKDDEEWEAIAAAVNLGIDSHLEALTERSVFDNGVCNVHPDELHVLLRRFAESMVEKAELLRSAILDTLGIEEI
jgi:hypothetical protein